MTAAHAGVEELDVFRLYKLVDMLDLTVFRRDKELQLLRQLAFRVTLDPVATKRVVYHVANNPVRCEKLGSSRNVILFDRSFIDVDDFVFPLVIVILVKPADDLNGILPIFFLIGFGEHFGNKAIAGETVVGE